MISHSVHVTVDSFSKGVNCMFVWESEYHCQFGFMSFSSLTKITSEESRGPFTWITTLRFLVQSACILFCFCWRHACLMMFAFVLVKCFCIYSPHPDSLNSSILCNWFINQMVIEEYEVESKHIKSDQINCLVCSYKEWVQ